MMKNAFIPIPMGPHRAFPLGISCRRWLVVGGLLAYGLGPVALAQSQAPVTDMQLQAGLREAFGIKDGLTVARLARQILGHDPLVPAQIAMAYSELIMINPTGFLPPNIRPDILRSEALRDLKGMDLLDDYLAETRKQLAVDPGSWRLNWQVGEAYAAAADATRDLRFLLPVPHWMKVTRQGSEFTAYRSQNGTDWTSVGHVTEPARQSLWVGLWVPERNESIPLVVAFEGFAIEDKTGSRVSPTTAWQEVDLGGNTTVGGAMKPATGPNDLIITGSVGRAGLNSGHYVYRSMEGDGSVVVRLPDVEPLPEDAQIGLLLRATLDSDFPAVRLAASRRRGFELGYTRGPGQWVGDPVGEIPASGWFKLGRAGDQVTASFSTDGTHWLPVFTRRLDLGSGALAGVMSVNSGTTQSFSWSGLGVHGPDIAEASASPKAAGEASALPRPWQFAAIGPRTEGSSATWVDNKVVLSLSGRTQDLTPKYFLFRPLAGNGEVSAMDLSVPHPEYGTSTALALRGSVAETDTEVRFGMLSSSGVLEFDVEGAGRHEAAEYFNRAAAAAPPNPQLVLAATLYDLPADRAGDAADAFGRLFKSDPAAAMSIADKVGLAFEKSGRIPELADLVGTLAPATGAVFASTVTTLSDKTQKNHPAESARFLRKAVELAGGPADAGAMLALAVRLQLANQPEAAAALLEKWYAGDAPPNPAEASQAKAFRQTLFNGSGYSTGNGQFTMPPTVDLLVMAVELGLGPKLRAAFDARDQLAPSWDGAKAVTDELFSIMLHLESRDPAYRAELDQYMQSNHGAALPNGGVIYVAMLAQELARWPEERPKALQILAQDLATIQASSPGNGGMLSRISPLIARQYSELGTRLGSRADAIAGLTMAVGELKNSLALPSASGEAGSVVHDLIAVGMLAEAADLIQAIRASAPVQNGAPRGRGMLLDRQVQAMQAELDQALKGFPGQTVAAADAGSGAKPAPPEQAKPNLLSNPGFVTLRDPAGMLTVPGWKFLRPGRTIRETGGPDPAHGYLILVPLKNSIQLPGELRVESERIPMTVTGDGYKLTGWTAGVTRFSFAFWDAAQKPLGQPATIQVRANKNDTWNQHAIRLAGAAKGGGAPDVVVPPGAAYLVLGLATVDEFKVAGLRLDAAGL